MSIKHILFVNVLIWSKGAVVAVIVW